jgi:phage terminase small subunit
MNAGLRHPAQGDDGRIPARPPEQPDYLTEGEQLIWGRIVAAMVESGVPILPCDAEVLSRYCKLKDVWDHIDMEAGWAPALLVKLNDKLADMEKSLGLTPLSRQRLYVNPDASKTEADELSELMGIPKGHGCRG